MEVTNMSNIVITSDSTSDLTPQVLAHYRIPIIPLHVLLGEKEFSDGVDITPQDIFSFVKEKNILPKTSATSVFEFTHFFEEQLTKHDYVLHFDISSEISSTYQNATIAAQSFGDRVRVIDSRNLSTGIGTLVLKACDLRDEGKSIDEIYDYCDKARFHVQTSFVVDTVEYLYKGGRCSSASFLATKIFGIHPSITMKDGKLLGDKKYRGNLKKCIEKYVSDLAETYKKYDKRRVFITHSSCSQDIVDAIVEEVKEKFDFEEIIPTIAGSVVTSHCGQGTLGVLFLKDE